jgi:PadR family transcriptional regulator PadR
MAVKNTQLKKGSAELLILSLLARRPMHGYELAKLIEARSEGAVRFKAASLYPLLYRLEHGGLIHGRWVEKAGQRRRRHYRVTAAGQKRLDEQRRTWSAFVAGVHRILEPDHG